MEDAAYIVPLNRPVTEGLLGMHLGKASSVLLGNSQLTA